MITSTFENYKKSFLPQAIEKALAEALLILEKTSQPDEGVYPLSDGARAIVMRYTSKEADTLVYESHDIMSDIQIVLEGEEYMYVRQSSDLTKSESGDDIHFYKERPKEFARVYLSKNTFCLVYPKEAHAPSIAVNAPSSVLKMVVKVPF